jgi:hypothetical protein
MCFSAGASFAGSVIFWQLRDSKKEFIFKKLSLLKNTSDILPNK